MKVSWTLILVLVFLIGLSFEKKIQNDKSQKNLKDNLLKAGANLKFQSWWNETEGEGDEGDYFSLLQKGDGTYYIESGEVTGALAMAYATEAMLETGWNELTIRTNSTLTDIEQMYAAGYLEGAITAHRISLNYANIYATPFSSQIMDWLQQNLNWSYTQAEQNHKTDPFWLQVYYVLIQMKGMADAYALYKSPSDLNLTLVNFHMLSGNGDMGTLEDMFSPTPLDKIWNSHCSALVKLTDDLNELLVGHATWASYYTMSRTYKVYEFQLNDPSAKSRSVAFSSYPGFIVSSDDFYMTDNGLWVSETTNDVYNRNLYKNVSPNSLLSWIRTAVANRMASSGSEWTNIFSNYNSGTYNNQWIIVDYKLFSAGLTELLPGTLWILEQIPGKCESADLTAPLAEMRYWPSYNIPFFPDIFNSTGYDTQCKKYGELFCYDTAPRAKIFQRDQSKVQSVSDLQWILRYNDYQHDPISQGYPSWTISSRYDLVVNSSNPFVQAGAFGAIDTKITSASMFKTAFSALAISGPTYYQQPVFSWDSKWNSIPHAGQPDVFNFAWFQFVPHVF